MPIGDPYATVAELENYTGKTDDGTFADLLDIASRSVEQFTRRQFNKETVASARRYQSFDWGFLATADFWTVDGLIVETTNVWDSSNYDPRPPDGIVAGQQGWPFSGLWAIGRNWPGKRRPTIKITAQWGWETVPTAVKYAVLDAAKTVATGGNTGAITSQSLGSAQISYFVPSTSSIDEVPKEFERLVPYRREEFGVA